MSVEDVLLELKIQDQDICRRPSTRVVRAGYIRICLIPANANTTPMGFSIMKWLSSRALLPSHVGQMSLHLEADTHPVVAKFPICPASGALHTCQVVRRNKDQTMVS